ncbi:hypothetical protein BC833DRAFT_374228 [Globomyces pollinis-pini]|nr:hypothetical protein BC833DRAFT_374228 [Globomyces pollinis-pini]
MSMTNSLLMLSFLVLAFAVLSFPMPGSPITAKWTGIQPISSNEPFKASFDLSFPAWATTPSMHWLAFDNPGPRPDNYLIEFNLVDENNKLVRPIYNYEYAAKNGPNNWKSEFFLPSYIIPTGQTTKKFKYHLNLKNLDRLSEVIFKKETNQYSEVFTFRKTSLTNVTVTDQMFVGEKDGIEGITVSFYRIFDEDNVSHLFTQSFQGTGFSTGPYRP